MSGRSEAATGGVSIFTLLGVLFIGLKLGHVIDWSWWYVLLPFYGMPLAILAVLGVIFIVSLLYTIGVAIKDDLKRQRR